MTPGPRGFIPYGHSFPLGSSRFLPEFEADTLRGAMQHRVLPWLNEGRGRSPELLCRWLLGYDLPCHPSARQNYECVLDGLPVKGTLAEAEKELALTTASLLSADFVGQFRVFPDEVLESGERDELWFNTLMLAACLPYPEHLAASLDALLDQYDFDRSYLGYPLRQALARACAINQPDKRWWPEWRAMLRDGGTKLLGSRADAFEAVLAMPPAADARGRPAYTELAETLGILARDFESTGDGDFSAPFNRAIERLQAFFGNEPGLLSMLFVDRGTDWPEWATMRLLDKLAELEPATELSACLEQLANSSSSDLRAGDFRQRRERFEQLLATIVKRTANSGPELWLQRAVEMKWPDWAAASCVPRRCVELKRSGKRIRFLMWDPFLPALQTEHTELVRYGVSSEGEGEFVVVEMRDTANLDPLMRAREQAQEMFRDSPYQREQSLKALVKVAVNDVLCDSAGPPP